MSGSERLEMVVEQALRLSLEEARAYVAAELSGDSESHAEALSLLEHRGSAASIFDSDLSAWIRALATRHNGAHGEVAGEAHSTSIGRYLLGERIGGGGMGDVYHATRADREFDQPLAIKLLRRGLDTEAIVARFVRERRVLARLSHANIAQFIDGGSTDDGRPFLVMEYVDGVSLLECCSARRLTIEDRLRLFMTLCEAVDFAHRHLVVHRDLKPGNILVTREGTLKLLDFGIAQLLDARDDSLTQPGLPSRPFTRAYAAPEQIAGEITGTAVDIFALGVILGEIVSGIRVSDSPRMAPARALAALVQRDPERAAALARERHTDAGRILRRLEGDLGTIISTATHADPSRRYSSVEALRADIDRLMRTLPISARTDSWKYRTAMFIRRNRWAVGSAAIVLALVLTSSTIVAIMAFRLSERSNSLKSALDDANTQRLETQLEYRRATAAGYMYTNMILAMAEADENIRATIVAELQRRSDRLDAPSVPIDAEAEISSRLTIGRTASALGASNLALHQFTRVLDLTSPEGNEWRAHAEAMSSAGSIHFRFGRYDEAITLLSTFQRLQEREYLCTYDLDLCEALLIRGRDEEARGTVQGRPLPPSPFDAELRERIARLEEEFQIRLVY